MSNFKQYADCNFYFSHSASNGRTDDNAYHDHRTLDREVIADMSLEGHPNEDEIYQIMLDVYRPEDLPSNGSTEGYIKGNLAHNPDTRDLAEQASNPTNQWANMMLSYQTNVRKLKRWAKGFISLTKSDITFNNRILRERDKMRASPKYRVKLWNRFQFLKSCNPTM